MPGFSICDEMGADAMNSARLRINTYQSCNKNEPQVISVQTDSGYS